MKTLRTERNTKSSKNCEVDKRSSWHLKSTEDHLQIRSKSTRDHLQIRNRREIISRFEIDKRISSGFLEITFRFDVDGESSSDSKSKGDHLQIRNRREIIPRFEIDERISSDSKWTRDHLQIRNRQEIICRILNFWPGQKCHSKVMHRKEVTHSNGS